MAKPMKPLKNQRPEKPLEYVNLADKQRKEMAAAREAGTFDARAHLDNSPVGRVLNAGAFSHLAY